MKLLIFFVSVSQFGIYSKKIRKTCYSSKLNHISRLTEPNMSSNLITWICKGCCKIDVNRLWSSSFFCCNIIHIITVKSVRRADNHRTSLYIQQFFYPWGRAGTLSAARGSLFGVCMGLYLISCVKVPLMGQNYGLSRRLWGSTGSDSKKVPSKLYFAGIFLLRIYYRPIYKY